MPTQQSSRGAILIVDDEPALRALAAAILRMLGHQVLQAANGAEAVQTFLEDPTAIAAVLLDMTMPVMGGEETFRHLREIRPDVPIVIVTGYDGVGFRPQMPAESLQKPYTDTELADALERVLQPTLIAAAPEPPAGFQFVPLSASELQGLTGNYVAHRKRELPRMVELLNASDFASLRVLSHTLKGSGGCYGFSELTRLGAALERAAERADAVSFSEKLTLLRNFLERI